MMGMVQNRSGFGPRQQSGKPRGNQDFLFVSLHSPYAMALHNYYTIYPLIVLPWTAEQERGHLHVKTLFSISPFLRFDFGLFFFSSAWG
jgi:hypothetical protein